MDIQKSLIQIDVISDIHLEFNPKINISPIIYSANYHILVMAGDIGYPTEEHYQNFLKKYSNQYDNIILIAGNHEYYPESKDLLPIKTEIIEQKIKKITENSNIIFLNRDSYSIFIEDKKITFLGCTLWSKIPEDMYKYAKNGLNDFNRIYLGDGNFITPKIYNEWHERDSMWLEQQINEKNNNEILIIVTHHLPTFKVVAPEYKEDPLTCCFATSLDDLFKNKLKMWICGHSHKPNYAVINNRGCLLNPCGYPWENKEYNCRTFLIHKDESIELK
jgi:predicted MPP superfamily phosphohydrolase